MGIQYSENEYFRLAFWKLFNLTSRHSLSCAPGVAASVSLAQFWGNSLPILMGEILKHPLAVGDRWLQMEILMIRFSSMACGTLSLADFAGVF